MEKQYTTSGFNYVKFLSEIEGTTYKSKLYASSGNEDLVLHFDPDLTAQEETDLDAAVAAHDPAPLPEYKIVFLVSDEFMGLPIENIDFARHLRGDIALNKKTYKSADGRPEKAEYYNGSDLVAEIEFVFTTDSSNLLTDRKLNLYFYKEDETKSEAILIKHKIYDPTDLVDGEAVVKERVDARQSIVSGMKAFLGAVLSAGLSKTLEEVIEIITPFWDEHEHIRNNFLELGTPEWENALIATDLATTPHTWLAIDIGGGITIRDYMVSRIGY